MEAPTRSPSTKSPARLDQLTGAWLQSSGCERMSEKELNCEKHGAYKAKIIRLAGRETATPCPECHKLQQAKEDQARRAEILERDRQARYTRASLPKRFVGRTLENWTARTPDQLRVLEEVSDFFRDPQASVSDGRSYAFIGGCGTGKTHLAVGMIRALIDAGFTAKYANVPEAIARVKATYGANRTESEEQVIESFTSPDLLVLDEVGVQFGTETENLVLFRILNRRYEDMKPTVLISNVTMDKLTAFVGERVIDRLSEGGGGILEFTWESARQ